MRSFSPQRGVTLIDVIVGSALVLIIFLGLFAIVRASLAVSSIAKVKATATSIATTRMEYIRSLPYTSVGTVGGIPAGLIPQNSTTTEAGIEFTTRTFIEYADDDADGLAGSDSNGITTDYKHIKVSVSFTLNNTARSVILVSNLVPQGIETTTGGGTLQVTVVDAVGLPVPGASVRIVNASTSPTIDLTTFTDTNGVVYLGGAATSTQYEVYVSKSDYSSAQTYLRDATNQNPTPGYLTVAENQTTGSTFAIDQLTSLIFRTFVPIAAGVFTDPFTDASGLSSVSNTSIVADALVLTGGPGTYPASGTAVSSTTAPTSLAEWVSASSTATLPPLTDARVSVADSAGTLLPDGVLTGNSTGFTGTIDLSGVSTTTYPALKLIATLSSTDPLVTPELLGWQLGYTAGPLPIGNVSFTLTGAKTIGSTGVGDPIFKTIIASTTDATGVRTLNLEWDLYDLVISGSVILVEEPEIPYELLPGTTLDARVIITP